MNSGKRFENNFRKSIPEDVFFYRFRDGSSSWGGNDKVRFQQTNICDCMIFDGENLFLLELKSTKGKSLPYSNIKEHQIDDLLWASDFANVICGFVIEFADINECYFIEIKDFVAFKMSSERKSLPIEFCSNKGVKIGVEKLRTNSRFDIKTFLNDSVKLI